MASAVAEFREILEQVFEQSSDAIALTRVADGRFLMANDALARLLAIDRNELMGRTSAELGVRPARGTRARLVERLQRDGSVGRAEIELVLPSGERRIAEYTAQLLEAADEPCILTVSRDITAQHSAEQALADSERRYRALAEASATGIWQLDAEGVIEYLNPASRAILQVDGPEDGIGERWERFFPPESREVIEHEGRKRRRGVSSTYEVALVTAKGARRTVLISGAPLMAADGTLDGLIGTIADISRRRRAEEALRRAEADRQAVLEQMIRATERERERMAAEIHDEIIQAVTAALMSLDRLSASPGKPEPLRAARRTLEAALDRLRILTFEIRPPLLDAHGLEPAVHALVETVAADAGLEARVTVEVDRYPFAVENVAYRTVQDALASVRKRRGARGVAVELHADGEALHGCVSDDGPVFDVAGALNPRSPRHDGGLETLVERVRVAGGNVDVSSRRGAGCCIRFTVPVADGSGRPADA